MSAFPNDTVPLFSGDFFEALRRRLVPLVGNLPEKVHSDRFAPDYAWIEVVSQLYPKHSFIAAREYRSLGATTKQWHIVRLLRPALRLIGEDDPIRAAGSFVDAVAFVAELSVTAGVWPDDLSLQADRLALYHRGDLFATVAPCPATPAASPDQLARARATLLGLRRGPQPPMEALLARVRKWPGMKQATLYADEQHYVPLLPEPLEWLISARLLCKSAGIDAPSQRLVQDVAATLLGAPSWNHLASGLRGVATRLVAPWYIPETTLEEGSRVFDQDLQFFLDPFDAFTHFMMRARQCGEQWRALGLAATHALDAGKMPIYIVSADRTWWHSQNVKLAPCPGVEASDAMTQRAALLVSEGADGLRDLFLIGRTGAERYAFRQHEQGLRPLATDGPFRFSLKTESFGEQFLDLAYVDPNEEVLASVSVPLSKSALYWCPDLVRYVLARVDVHRTEPVAVLSLLGRRTVECVCAVCGGDINLLFDTLRLSDLTPREQQDLQQLAQSEVPVHDGYV